jgi:hypothetical protein
MTLMSRAEWRVPGAYETLRSLDAPGFAWEYLRRNQDFLRDRRKLQKDDSRGSLDPGEVQRFTRRWGVRFREHGPAGKPEPDCLGPPRLAKHRCPDLAAVGII